MGSLGQDVLNFGGREACREFAFLHNFMLAAAVFFGALAFNASDMQVLVAYLASVPAALVLWRHALSDGRFIGLSRCLTLALGAAFGAASPILGVAVA